MSIPAGKIDNTKITLSDPKTLENGGKMLFLNYGGGINPLYVTTPEVEIPFDPSYFPDNENSGKYSVKFSMKNVDDNKSMRDFHTWALSMDDLLLKKASENTQAWFRKAKMSDETIKELYTPMVRVSVDPETGEPNGKYPDSFGFKVVKRDGRFKDFSIYDNKKVVFDVNKDTDDGIDISKVLLKGSLIKAVLKCNGVWIANGKFGCTWRAEQIRVKVPEGGLEDFAILSESEESDDEEVRSTLNDNNQQEKVLIDTSSDEEVPTPQEPEPEPEPEQVKKEKKVVKKVRKKKVSVDT